MNGVNAESQDNDEWQAIAEKREAKITELLAENKLLREDLLSLKMTVRDRESRF